MPSNRIPDASLDDIQSELRRRERLNRQRLNGLIRTHDRLTRKLSFIKDQIELLERELGVTDVTRRRARMKQGLSLADSIVAVLTKRPKKIDDIMEAVKANGYVSTSPNFRIMVTQILIKDRRIKRVRRGQYAAR